VSQCEFLPTFFTAELCILLTPISRALATAPQNYVCFASFIRVSLSDVCSFELEEVSSRPPLACRDWLSCLLTLPKAAQEDNSTH